MADIKKFLDSSSENVAQNDEKLLLCLESLKNDDAEIDDDDVNNILAFLSKKKCETSLILNIVAQLARNEKNRTPLTKEELIREIVSHISSDDSNVTLQSLRCLCNICAENDEARNMFLLSNGVKSLITKSMKVVESDNSDWNKVILPACSCIQNVISDSESLQEEFLKEDALNLLFKFLEKFYQADDEIKISTSVIVGIAALSDSDKGLQAMEENNILSKLLDILKKCSDTLLDVFIDNMLTEYSGKENTRSLLCKIGCVKTVSELAEKRQNYKENECTDTILKKMADIIVLLTSGEASFDILVKEDKELLARLSNWIESPNRHIQVTAGLALGNYARSDETCKDIVKNKIHENMINVIKENIDNESYSDRLEAYASCLRNLTIPVDNKTMLIESGVPEVAVNLVKKSGLPVQFKALAILRLLIQGHEDLANKLLADKELIEKVCELSETSVVSSVPSEAQRLIAALTKYSNSGESISTALSYGCMNPIVTLLASEHSLMQNEGLIGLIMTLANVNDCLPIFKDAECLSKVMKLLKQDGVQPQTLFNGLTFLQALSSIAGGKDHMISLNINELLEVLKEHSEAIIREKAIETIGLLN